MSKKIYIAGGWFSEEQREALYQLEELEPSQSFRPRIDTAKHIRDWNKIYQENIKHLQECEFIIASTVGKDMGTLWECGYAAALKKTIIYYTPGITKPNLMLGMSGVICTSIREIQEYLYSGKSPEVTDYE